MSALRRSRSRQAGPLPVQDDGATDALVEHGARLVLTVDVAAAAVFAGVELDSVGSVYEGVQGVELPSGHVCGPGLRDDVLVNVLVGGAVALRLADQGMAVRLTWCQSP